LDWRWISGLDPNLFRVWKWLRDIISAERLLDHTISSSVSSYLIHRIPGSSFTTFHSLAQRKCKR
jgi:hypothetical protein